MTASKTGFCIVAARCQAPGRWSFGASAFHMLLTAGEFNFEKYQEH